MCFAALVADTFSSSDAPVPVHDAHLPLRAQPTTFFRNPNDTHSDSPIAFDTQSTLSSLAHGALMRAWKNGDMTSSSFRERFPRFFCVPLSSSRRPYVVNRTGTLDFRRCVGLWVLAGACGKTSLLCCFALGDFPKEYVRHSLSCQLRHQLTCIIYFFN